MTPILAPSTRIARPRVTSWLLQTRATRLRLICAPIGAGKSAALADFAARPGAQCTYQRVPHGADASFVHDLLSGCASTDLIFDEADGFDRSAIAALVDHAGAGGPRLIVAARSRFALGAHALLARGLATRCDPALLAFDAAEIARLADAYGVGYEPADVDAVAFETEGWALAAEWLIRDAAEDGRPLRDAAVRWRERNGHLLLEFLRHERWTDERESDAFFELLGGGWSAAQADLERLEAHGFPLIRTRDGVRPHRILARLGAAKRDVNERMSLRLAPPMMVALLGRFRCEVGGRAVAFARRRDQQLFAYVALANGGVSRKTLLDEFWAGTDPQIGTQSLRTALSRIRRAIADAVPDGNPDRYFTTDGDVRIVRGAVVVDARRFIDQVEAGRLDDGRGDAKAAIVHYRNAHRAFVGSLLESEGTEPCLTRRGAVLESLRCDMLGRLAALYAALGDHDAADVFARELGACTNAATA